MVDHGGELKNIDLILTDLCTLRLTVKSSNGKLYLDIRKWFKYPTSDELLPSKKGLMLEFSEWKKVIKEIQSIMDEMMMDKAA